MFTESLPIHYTIYVGPQILLLAMMLYSYTFSQTWNQTFFVLWPTKAQLIYKLSHSYMFQHYWVTLRELAISTSPSYTSISNAAVGVTI